MGLFMSVETLFQSRNEARKALCEDFTYSFDGQSYEIHALLC